MINDGVNNVPEKTIAIFSGFEVEQINKKRLSNIFKKPSRKKEMFSSNAYRCLPLVVGSQYGFTVHTEFDLDFFWTGEADPDALIINHNASEEMLPIVENRFGNGILTFLVPVTLRTPPGVNLFTINPPNEILPNLTVISAAIETDNLRRNFTFNLKVQEPNIMVHLPKGTAISGFIPIPRNFADDFKLVDASDIFSNEIIEEEMEAIENFDRHREEVEPTLPGTVGRFYFKGFDIYGNKFKNHQGPK